MHLFLLFLIFQLAVGKYLHNHTAEISKRLRVFSGKNLRVSSTASLPPFAVRETLDEKLGSYSWYGVAVNMLLHAGKKLNFTFEIIVDPQGPGSVQSNGTWTGAMGALIRREVDLSMIAHTLSRHGHVDLTRFFGYIGIHYWTSFGRSDSKIRALTASYSPLMWILILASFASVTLVLKLSSGKKLTIPKSLFFVFSMMVEVSCPNFWGFPDLKSRLTLSLWLFFQLIVSTGYKTDLVASLSLPAGLSKIPETTKELAEAQNYKLNWHHINSAGVNFFRSSKNPVIKNLKSRFIEASLENCLAGAFKGKK